MKKPEDAEPKDLTEEDKLSESDMDEVSGGVLTPKPTVKSLDPSTPSIRGCNCNKGAGSTADWTAVS